MAHLEFFFDLSSPWTRLAFQNIQPILAETGASAAWRPFLVGGVFNAVNPSVYEARKGLSAPSVPARLAGRLVQRCELSLAVSYVVAIRIGRRGLAPL